MSVNVYLSGDPVHDRVLQAFYDGCPEAKRLCKVTEFEPADVAVVFGIRKSRIPISFPRGEIIRRQKEEGGRLIVLETGYINRGDGLRHHYAAGWNGLNGRADFRNKGMPPERARKLGVELKPWRKDGVHVLLCGQVPWDASVDHHNHYHWVAETAVTLKRHTQRPVIFRPHPLAKLAPLEECGYSKLPLADDLLGAHCVVTFNSNSAVEALIAGVPAICQDEGSMAWGVCDHDLSAVEDPAKPDREQWFADLTYAQWTLPEMADGDAWRHLSR